MTNNIITKYGYDSAGAIFASAFTSKDYALTNYKYIDFVVAHGQGEQASITAQVFGKNNDETEKALPFRRVLQNGLPSEYLSSEGAKLTIGTGGIAVYRVTADDLAKDGFDCVCLKLSAADGSTVTGSVVAVSHSPRYSGTE
jgi:hypothetical protein